MAGVSIATRQTHSMTVNLRRVSGICILNEQSRQDENTQQPRETNVALMHIAG